MPAHPHLEMGPHDRLIRQALVRRHYGDGRWGRDIGDHRSVGGIMTRKTRPAEGVIVWAKSTSGKARLVHSIRYQLEARENGKTVGTMTVWRCGGQCFSPVEKKDSVTVCRKCRDFALPTEATL